MQPEEIQKIFDQQAASYDQQWHKLAPLRETLHLLMAAVFADLPEDASMLCVGVGTGSEMFSLARQFPEWHFTAVEPSSGMLAVCRQRAEELGMTNRCTFHEGYLDSLSGTQSFHCATALLVSQFLLERKMRTDFFRAIAQRLHPDGILVSSDLSADIRSSAYADMLKVWLRLMRGANVSPEDVERLRAGYGRDVAVTTAQDIEAIIADGGFRSSFPLFQAGLIRAWYSIRA